MSADTSPAPRSDGRADDELRPVTFTRHWLDHAAGSVLVEFGDGVPRLDLHYDDDVRAETDMNVVMTGDGRFVEVQGTAEGAPFDRAELDALLVLAGKGCGELTRLQRAALEQ